jgi:molybdopterin converting factor small subunit
VAIDAEKATIADVLAALGAECPGVVDRVLDETGAIRRHVNVFIGDTNVRNAGGLSAAVPDGCEVSILPAVSGG